MAGCELYVGAQLVRFGVGGLRGTRYQGHA